MKVWMTWNEELQRQKDSKQQAYHKWLQIQNKDD